MLNSSQDRINHPCAVSGLRSRGTLRILQSSPKSQLHVQLVFLHSKVHSNHIKTTWFIVSQVMFWWTQKTKAESLMVLKVVSMPSLLKLTGIHLPFQSERNAGLHFHLVHCRWFHFNRTSKINKNAFFLDRMRSSGSCGRRNVNFEPPRPSSTRLGRVVNGVDAPVGAIPWQVCLASPWRSKLSSLIDIEFD